MKNRILLFVLIILFATTGIFAKQNKTQANFEIGSYTNSWEIYEFLELVNVYYCYSDCSVSSNKFYPEYMLFKVENKKDKKVYVYWDYTRSYDGNKKRAGIDENLVQVFPDSEGTDDVSCLDVYKTKPSILVRNKIHKSVLTEFDLNIINEYKLIKELLL